VGCYDRRRRLLIDEQAVIDKFGVAPQSIPDYLALVGDSADGIPGIPGWGARSAAAVLGRWGHLERIPPDPARWEVLVRGAARLAANLAEHHDEVRLYRTLTTLRLDVPLAEGLDELEWKGVHQDRFLDLCDELGFEEVRTRPHRWS
jgi:5'-3' exonuclease